jgi:hypothetical protein
MVIQMGLIRTHLAYGWLRFALVYECAKTYDALCRSIKWRNCDVTADLRFHFSGACEGQDVIFVGEIYNSFPTVGIPAKYNDDDKAQGAEPEDGWGSPSAWKHPMGAPNGRKKREDEEDYYGYGDADEDSEDYSEEEGEKEEDHEHPELESRILSVYLSTAGRSEKKSFKVYFHFTK